MFNSNFNNGFNPYPYNFNMQNNGVQPQFNNPYQQNQPQQQMATNTNIIYVNGIDDVRNRNLPANSDYVFFDNDKPLIYQKVVSSNGQFEVKAFNISPYNAENLKKTNESIDLSEYLKISDLDPLKAEINDLKSLLKKMENNNATKNQNK